MEEREHKTIENKSISLDYDKSYQSARPVTPAAIVDSPSTPNNQSAIHQLVNNTPRALQLKANQELANESTQCQEAMQFYSIANGASGGGDDPGDPAESNNNTGLPDDLKSGLESLSGFSLDGVKVHRNSDKPAQLKAHAYAQGEDIHLGPGQEKHLPHEAWHVVQQKQGRVKPTLQINGKVNINDDAGLEKEADVMGGKAVQQKQGRVKPTMQMKAKVDTGTNSNTPLQLKPSTFAPAAKTAINIKPGKSQKSKAIRSSLAAFDVFGVLNTPWTELQKALNYYISLADDPVDENHLIAIREVERRIVIWKNSHQPSEKGLNDDEKTKLDAIEGIESLLEDEIQFARISKLQPISMEGIVMERLEFILQDCLDDDFLAVHSARTWNAFQAAFGHHRAELLEQDLPTQEQLIGLDGNAIALLAGDRVQTLRGNTDPNAKISLHGLLCTNLGRIANVEVDQIEVLGPSAQKALLDIVTNELHDHYPELADDIEQRILVNNIMGVDLNTFFRSASETFLSNTYDTVEPMTDIDLSKLRNDIYNAQEYTEFVAIATVHNNPFHTGEHLPQNESEEDGEDLIARERELLEELTFELQEKDLNGTTTRKGLEVPNDKKKEVVMAVMTVEKLAAKKFGQYPHFILVRKEGGKYRANADSESQYIRYDVDFEMRTAVHELGHFYENQAELSDWYSVYLLMRSRHNQKANVLEKSTDATYGSSHIGAPDEPGFLGGIDGMDNGYQKEYTARYYTTGHTEMMSMFTERLINETKMDAMIENDPQAFAILLRTLRSDALPNWSDNQLGFVKN